MRVLVTGATGFIGSHLVEALQAQGHQVVCLVRQSSSRSFLPDQGVQYVVGSLGDPASLAAAVAGVERVYHLAGATKALRPADFLRANATATQNLLDACVRSAQRLNRFLLVSSLSAAGPSANGRPCVEDDPPRPVSWYGKSKLAAENIANSYGDRLPVTVVRPPAVYGPRDRDILHYFKQVKMGVALKLGSGERELSIIHVTDLVNGILRAGEAVIAVGALYFLTHDKPESWTTIGQAIADALAKHPLKVTVPEFIAPVVAGAGELIAQIRRKPALLGKDKIGEMREKSWVCSSKKAADELGFQAAIPFRDGIAMTAIWYRANGWL